MAKQTMQTNSNQKKKRRTRNLLSFIMCAVSLFLFIIPVIKEVSTTIGLKKDIASAVDELNEIKAEKKKLQAEKKQLNDPNYVDSYARGKYMATKEGEQVFILPDNE